MIPGADVRGVGSICPGMAAAGQASSCDDAAMRVRSSFVRSIALVVPAVWLAAAGPAAAHGPAPAEPPTLANLLLGWTFQPLPTLAIGVALGWWWWAVRRVDAAHPANPVPRRRTVAFVSAQVALGFALLSGIERYDTTLFSVHMVQHLLLMFVAAPLLVLAGADHPVAAGVLAAGDDAGSSCPSSTRGRACAGLSLSRGAVRAVMWGDPLLAAVQRGPGGPVHPSLEHRLFLGTALLFWWPVLARIRTVSAATGREGFMDMPSEHVPRGGDLTGDGAVPALRHAADVGPDADRGPAARRRHHVDRR